MAILGAGLLSDKLPIRTNINDCNIYKGYGSRGILVVEAFGLRPVIDKYATKQACQLKSMIPGVNTTISKIHMLLRQQTNGSNTLYV